MNKRFIILLIFTLTFISACDIDDICTEGTTPNLVLRFYDATSTITLKNTERLSIIAMSNTDSLVTNQSLDSIAIPLNPLAQQTVYTFKSNTDDGSLATNKTTTLTISYSAEEEYISRSCGYRFTFKDIEINIDNPTTSWISSITPTTIPSITNQNSAHVQVYH